MNLITLGLEQPTIRADYEASAPTGASLSDIKSMEQFLIGVRSKTGQTVTPEKARRCSVVLACMRGISEDISSLPLNLMKTIGKGAEVASEHPVHRILNIAPNAVQTPMELREHMIMDMMLFGGFYNLKNENPENPGVLDSVWPLQAGYVTRQSQELLWTFTDPLSGVSGTFTPDTVWRGTNMASNGLDGVALTLLAREAIGLMLASEEQAARLFSHGIQSDFALSTDDVMDGEAKDQLREALMRRHSGSGNAWMPLIFEGGLKASRIGLTAVESQYIEARKYQTSDIARVFRYPEVLLGGGEGGGKASTFASAEQFFSSYTKHTLGPWATRIEQTIRRDLLTTKEQTKYYAKHDFNPLLKADRAARFAAYGAGIAAGILSPADARAEEGLPYVPGLDYYTRPLNSTATAGADASSASPTDQSASGPARRIAAYVLQKEQRAIEGKKQDADVFYAHFGGFVASITGAPASDVAAYLDSRRSNPDRFTADGQSAALAQLSILSERN